MLHRALHLMTDSELRRVLDAPIERWGHFSYYRLEDQSSCLIGHALGFQSYYDYLDAKDSANPRLAEILTVRKFSTGVEMPITTEMRFDQLCCRFGVARVVRAVKIRALRILLSRGAACPDSVAVLGLRHPSRTLGAFT